MIPCGPEVEGIVEGVKQFVEAGFERVALVQVGDRQKEFCEFFESELGEALRDLWALPSRPDKDLPGEERSTPEQIQRF